MKEFLYVGYYFDENGEFILKIGTTNDLERRKAEHTRNYRKSPEHRLPKDAVFNYLWALPLSKYNTLSEMTDFCSILVLILLKLP